MTAQRIRPFHEDDLLTVAQAASVAQRSARTIRRAYLSARLVAHRDGNGRTVRIRYADLLAWLMAEPIAGTDASASTQTVGRADRRRHSDGRVKSVNLELLSAARARRLRAAGVSSAARPAGDPQRPRP
jgi:excisionase family DNA binding protein